MRLIYTMSPRSNNGRFAAPKHERRGVCQNARAAVERRESRAILKYRETGQDSCKSHSGLLPEDWRNDKGGPIAHEPRWGTTSYSHPVTLVCFPDHKRVSGDVFAI